MIYAAHDNKYALVIVQDDDPLNPRKDYDNLGKMICWHSRYDLGDKHDFEDPISFLRNLYRNSIEDHGAELINYLISGQSKSAALKHNDETKEWDLYVVTAYRILGEQTPPAMEVSSSAPESQLGEYGWFFDDMLEALSSADLIALINKHKDIVLLPLFLYDHSMLSISTGSFIGRAQHAEWDSGMVGFIYADHDMILSNFGTCNDSDIEKTKEVLEAEVKEYDHYLQGEVYGYRVYKYGDETDSCWGFVGDIEDVKKDIRDCIDDEAVPLLDQMKWENDDSADDYVDGIEFVEDEEEMEKEWESISPSLASHPDLSLYDLADRLKADYHILDESNDLLVTSAAHRRIARTTDNIIRTVLANAGNVILKNLLVPTAN